MLKKEIVYFFERPFQTAVASELQFSTHLSCLVIVGHCREHNETANIPDKNCYRKVICDCSPWHSQQYLLHTKAKIWTKVFAYMCVNCYHEALNEAWSHWVLCLGNVYSDVHSARNWFVCRHLIDGQQPKIASVRAGPYKDKAHYDC